MMSLKTLINLFVRFKCCLLKFKYYCMSLQERDTTVCSLELLIFIVDVADTFRFKTLCNCWVCYLIKIIT